MNNRGFTLIELLITLTILSIIIAIGIPSFSEQIKNSRTKTATLALLDAIETARSTAVYRNKRTMLVATNQKWHKGWQLFVDLNDDGQLNNDETVILKADNLPGVIVKIAKNNNPLKNYFSFIGTGEGRKPGAANRGAFLSGTLMVCPEIAGDGYALILSRGGRTRVSKLSQADCDAASF